MRINNTMKKIGLIVLAMVLLLSMTLTAEAATETRVTVGGMPFGVRFHTEGVTVAGFERVKTPSGDLCPAKDAGLLTGDVILEINGEKVSSAEELAGKISASTGEITVTYRRGGATHKAKLSPVTDKDGKRRAGMWIRDVAAGIGTVTFYDEKSGRFGGLGHGICNSETGELLPLSHGTVTEVTLCGINRGTAGAPGELKGYFGIEKIGEVSKNERTGIYGVLTKLPHGGETMVVAKKSQVVEGEVTIRCTLSDGEMRDYKATISDIDKSGGECKNFIITVTDEELLRQTGGIVQGMSGSPIIQNGRLIGAVTHVLVNDPTRGYGIFIENMLEAVR